MQAKMENLQTEIASLEVEGKSGGGLVTLRLTGKGDLVDSAIAAIRDVAGIETELSTTGPRPMSPATNCPTRSVRKSRASA